MPKSGTADSCRRYFKHLSTRFVSAVFGKYGGFFGSTSQQTMGANVEFQEADCYSLPFAEATFDRVFSHALLEHLKEPQKAVAEFHRVLRPGGEVGLCSPDWGGFILAPPSDDLSRAIEAYQALQSKNGGDVHVGRKLGVLLGETGFEAVHMSARYECYPTLGFIGEYLTLQLERARYPTSAESLRAWSCCQGGMFAQAWVAATARKRQ